MALHLKHCCYSADLKDSSFTAKMLESSCKILLLHRVSWHRSFLVMDPCREESPSLSWAPTWESTGMTLKASLWQENPASIVRRSTLSPQGNTCTMLHTHIFFLVLGCSTTPVKESGLLQLLTPYHLKSDLLSSLCCCIDLKDSRCEWIQTRVSLF